MKIKELFYFFKNLEQLDLSQKYPAIFLSLKKDKIAGYHLVINALKTFNDMLCLQMTEWQNVREATQDVDNSETKPRITEWKECKTLNYRHRGGGVISTNGKGLIDSEWDRKYRGTSAIFKCELVHV